MVRARKVARTAVVRIVLEVDARRAAGAGSDATIRSTHTFDALLQEIAPMTARAAVVRIVRDLPALAVAVLSSIHAVVGTLTARTDFASRAHDVAILAILRITIDVGALAIAELPPFRAKAIAFSVVTHFANLAMLAAFTTVRSVFENTPAACGAIAFAFRAHACTSLGVALASDAVMPAMATRRWQGEVDATCAAAPRDLSSVSSAMRAIEPWFLPYEQAHEQDDQTNYRKPPRAIPCDSP